MRACTPMERAFIYALVACGGNYTDAALAAGYGAKSDTREQRLASAQQSGANLMRRERVLEAVNEEAKKRLRSGALLAANRLIELLQNDSLTPKDRFRAATEVLDRAGLVVQQRVEVTHKTEKEDELIAEITALATKVGLDPKALLGYDPPKITDAEFVSVVRLDIPAELEDIL